MRFCRRTEQNPLRLRRHGGIDVTSDPMAPDENPRREFCRGRSPECDEESSSAAEIQQRLKANSSRFRSRRKSYARPGRIESSF
jgi:hypothetical protein